MLKYILIVSLAFLTQTLFGQSYSTRIITNKADSILISNFGVRQVRDYFVFDTNSWYYYTSKAGKQKARILINDLHTKGNFCSIELRYNLRLVKDSMIIYCVATVTLDDKLNLWKLNINNVPSFIKKDQPLNLISRDSALKIAKATFKQQGVESIKITLGCNDTTCIYTCINTLTK